MLSVATIVLCCVSVASGMGEKQRSLVAPLELSEAEPGSSGALVRVYLIRHGQTDYNAAGRIQGSGVDRPLSEIGLTQAECIGEALRDIPLDLVGSSTMTRAVQTAEAIAKHHQGANRVEHVGLREMSFGEFEGKVVSENLDGYNEVNRAWAEGDVDRHWPSGESPVEVVERARSALRDLGLLGINDERGVRHVALVTHGRFNKIVLASLLGKGLDQCGTIKQDNCCINVIDIDPCASVDSVEACTEVLLNFSDHLTPATRKQSGPS